MRSISIILLIMLFALRASAQLPTTGAGFAGTGTPVVACTTSLVFDQTVACNAVSYPLLGK